MWQIVKYHWGLKALHGGIVIRGASMKTAHFFCSERINVSTLSLSYVGTPVTPLALRRFMTCSCSMFHIRGSLAFRCLFGNMRQRKFPRSGNMASVLHASKHRDRIPVLILSYFSHVCKSRAPFNYRNREFLSAHSFPFIISKLFLSILVRSLLFLIRVSAITARV